MSFRSISDVLPTRTTDLLALVKVIEERAKSRPHSPTASERAAVVQLPLWGDEVRCMPNEILRSALFNAKNRNQPRRYFENEEIAVIGRSTRITYTGKELRQSDESVWLQLVHLARLVPLGCPIEFTAYSMVQSLRQARSKPNPQHVVRLLDSLRRMQASSLSVYSKRLRRGVGLSMIPKFEWQDEATGSRLPMWRAWVAPEMVELFGDVHFTQLQWNQRLALPSGLATWMHGYLASHRDPLPIKLSTLYRGAGCTTDTPRKFKQLMATALGELKQVGFLSSFEIRGELVRVNRR
ncbi:plasmid replication initiator TrfA [Massilia luteola]|uniref:plasmid replication initiator TrfA n=1 Tax=Massilia luteola TaxID=3081751 RepID=UPI002ACC0B73|nr:plasmid replication initiator TrfA [Massilia sp. Gc5]